MNDQLRDRSGEIGLTDTHAHLDRLLASGHLPAAMQRARDAGVRGILAVGGSPAANRAALTAAQAYPGFVRAAVGFDREQAGQPFDRHALLALAAQPAVAALGEIGLDYHYHPDTAAGQRALMEAQLELAIQTSLPVILHSREAEADTLALLRAHWTGLQPSRPLKGVLHCFTGTRTFADALLELGCMISFSGILTFKDSTSLRETALHVPHDRLLVETDTPYLAPHPFRGRPNEPGYVVHVNRTLAGLLSLSETETARLTTRNAEHLFGPWKDMAS